MAQSVGTVYVEVVPSGKGFGKSIEGDISSAAASGSKKGSTSILGGIGGAFKKVGKVGVGAITAVGAGVVALAAKGGFERALNIENAQTKLKALGHSTSEVKGIMNDALGAVKGTAFGMGDAASVAATMVASGVKQGKELKGVLTTVADTAQISGRSMNDIGQIFSQVAAKGKLQGDEMLQLMSSGIPVLQFLAKHYHVTSAEAQKMVSEGKVSFKDFAAAMQENIGGAAKKSGESFTGAWKNVQAALSRLGEKLATPIINGLTDLFNQAIPLVDGFTSAVSPVLENVGNGLKKGFENALPSIKKFFDGMANNKSIQNLAGAIKDLFDGMGNLTGAIWDVVSTKSVVDTFINGFKKGIKAISDVVTPFAAGVKKNFDTVAEALRIVAKSDEFKAFLKLVKEMQGAFSDLFSAVGDFIKKLSDLTGIKPEDLANAFKKALVILMGPLMSVIAAVKILTKVVQLATWAMGVWKDIFSTIGKALQSAGDAISGWWEDNVQPIVDKVSGFFSTIGEVVSTAFGTLFGSFSDFSGSVAGIFNGLGQNITNAWNSVVAFFSSIPGRIAGFFNGIGQWLSEPFTSAGNSAQSVWNSVAAFFSSIPGRIAGFFNGIGSWLSSPFTSAGGTAQSAWNGVVSFFGGIPGRIRGFFSGSGSWLGKAGQAIMNGFLGGLKNAWKNVTDFVSGIGSWIQAHKGPISYDRKLLIPAGLAIMNGLNQGLQSQFGTVKSTISTMNGEIGRLLSADSNMGIGATVSAQVETSNTALANGIEGVIGAITTLDGNLGNKIADNAPRFPSRREFNRLSREAMNV